METSNDCYSIQKQGNSFHLFAKDQSRQRPVSWSADELSGPSGLLAIRDLLKHESDTLDGLESGQEAVHRRLANLTMEPGGRFLLVHPEVNGFNNP